MGTQIIRRGVKSDIESIVDMARGFWGQTIYDEEYCPETVANMAEACINAGLMSVVDDDGVVGFACGMKGPLLGNASVVCGIELAWWIDPKYRNENHGVNLLMHLEQQARDAGIKYWNMVYMVSSMPDVVEKIYQKLGYNKIEVTYQKVL